MFKYFLIIYLVISCGKFTISPYSIKIADQHLNKNGLDAIALREASFSNSFKVALISDSHDYYSELDELIDYINLKKSEYAFVIITGDITNIGLLSEFEMAVKLYKKLEIPFVMAVGNHDLLTNGKILFEKFFGIDTFAFNFKQTRFNIINNNNWELASSRDNKQWITDDITANPKTHHIVLSHVSMEDVARFSQAKIDAWKQAGINLGIKYFINGHDHNRGVNDFGNAKRITVGSPSNNGFAELIITDGGVTHAFVTP